MLALPLFIFPAAARAQEAPLELEVEPGPPTTTRILETAVRRSRGTVGSEALKGLRALRDPALRPLFSWLASGQNAAQRRAGVLGLAEIEDPSQTPASRGIDPMVLSRIEDEAEQSAILGEAISLDLVGVEQIERILTWPLLEPYMELLLRSRLAGLGKPINAARVSALAETGGMATESLAAVLLAQTGKPERLEDVTGRLLGMSGAAIGVYVSPLLETIRRDNLSAASPLLARLEAVYSTSPTLNADVFRVWLHVAPADALPAWKVRFGHPRSLADSLRLAMVLLDAYEQVGADAFDPVLQQTGEPLLVALGTTGRALASNQGVETALRELAFHRHFLADQWAVERAPKWDPEIAASTYRAILQAQEERHSRRVPVNLAVPIAAGALSDVDPVFIRSLLERACANSDEYLAQAVLAGMVRSGSKPVWDPDNHPKWPDHQCRGMAILIEAKHPDIVSFEGQRLESLGELASGVPTLLPSAMHAQAAWLYARIRGQTETVLARVLAGQN